MNIIRMTHEEFYNVEGLVTGIIYVPEGRILQYGWEQLETDIKELMDNMGVTESKEDIIHNWLKDYHSLSEKEAIKLYNDWWGGYDLGVDLDKEDLENGYYDTLNYDTQEYLMLIFKALSIEEGTGYEQILNSLGLKTGTVGRSNWSVYIAPDKLELDYIIDMYEGYSIYQFQLLSKEGKVLNSVRSVYTPTDKDIEGAIEAYFGVDEFYLVDNEESTYVDLPKVKEVKHIEYEYEVV